MFTFIRLFVYIWPSKIFKILSMHIMRAYSKEFFIFFIVLELAGISFALNFRNQWSVHLENRIKSSFHSAQKYGKKCNIWGNYTAFPSNEFKILALEGNVPCINLLLRYFSIFGALWIVKLLILIFFLKNSLFILLSRRMKKYQYEI